MGIILEKSKLVFDELIGPSSFDEIFKNNIRDYYTYGFKSYDQFSKGSQIIKDRWKIFSKVLGSKWYFEKRKNGRNQITLKTMSSGSDNPIDELYFLHNLSKAGDYLNYLLDLDPHSYLRGGIAALPVGLEELETVDGDSGVQRLEDVDTIEYAIISNWEYKLERTGDEKYDCFPVRINRQLNIWSSRTRYMPKSFRDKYANLGNRTEYLYSLGVIGDLRDDPKQRNKWLRRQWDMYDSRFKRYFNSETSGDHFWYKSPLTMANISAYCCKEGQDEQIKTFLVQFKAMCEFFSQYYPMGELGTLLAERCSSRTGNVTQNVFKFKHNYLQKTLYDYNLIDILTAIENRFLCWIEYSHGTNLNSYEEIIIPLEIRISVTNGREYVLYYHVAERRIKALRLEFIDKITMYSQVSYVKQVQRNVCKSGKKINRTEVSSTNIKIDEKDLVRQVIRAEKMLPYIWGTEVGNCEVIDSWESQLVSFIMPITYDSESEKYIENRLRKEKRLSADDKCIRIFPTKELRNWIRSFYMRIGNPSVIHIENFDISEDVNSMWNIYFKNEDLPGDGVEEYRKSKDTEYTEFGYVISGNVVPTTDGHGALFNELFSKYTIVLANSLLNCSGDNCSVNFEKILMENIKASFEYYTSDEAQRVFSELHAYIKDAELVNDKGQSRFVIEQSDYLFDMLPLTKVEVRWLLTVLDDPLSTVFLSSAQLESIKEVLKMAPFDTNKFKLGAINYYDRYNLEDRMLQGKKNILQNGRFTARELGFLQQIYNAVKAEEKVEIVYKNWRGDTKYASLAPAWIEYSRRDDVFRVWYVQNEKNQIHIINIPRIMSITNRPGEHYDLLEQQKKLESILERTMTHIKVEFYQGDRNLPDRLLTEFSLWKKKCTYDVITHKYTMTLYYSSLDEKEIMVRLLSYGAYIKILASDDNYVLNELRERIAAQKDIIRTREFEL